MRPRPTALLALLAAAAVAAGCAPTTKSSSNSVSKFRGDERLVAQTVEDLQAAGTDGDQTKICDELLARSLAGRLAATGHSCPAAVKTAIKNADTFDMTVQSVRVTGDHATANVTIKVGDKDRKASFDLVREAGRWKIASL